MTCGLHSFSGYVNVTESSALLATATLLHEHTLYTAYGTEDTCTD